MFDVDNKINVFKLTKHTHNETFYLLIILYFILDFPYVMDILTNNNMN